MSSTQEILLQLTAGTLDIKEAHDKIKELENEKKNGIIYKVSKKGCISFYGIRKRPISLYIQELESIIKKTIKDTTWSDEFQKFVDDNESTLSRK